MKFSSCWNNNISSRRRRNRSIESWLCGRAHEIQGTTIMVGSVQNYSLYGLISHQNYLHYVHRIRPTGNALNAISFWLIGLRSPWACLIQNDKLLAVCLGTHFRWSTRMQHTPPLPPTHLYSYYALPTPGGGSLGGAWIHLHLHFWLWPSNVLKGWGGRGVGRRRW